jgi:hypothetical protein
MSDLVVKKRRKGEGEEDMGGEKKETEKEG